jgi:hypothetical protein
MGFGISCMIGKIGYFIEGEENDDMWVALSFCFLDLLIFSFFLGFHYFCH